APCAELLDILQEVSGHLLIEEPADEDIAVAARVSTDLVRNLQSALARGVEPGAELLGRDARSGLGLNRRDKEQSEERQKPEHGKLLQGKVRDRRVEGLDRRVCFLHSSLTLPRFVRRGKRPRPVPPKGFPSAHLAALASFSLLRPGRFWT